MLHLILKLINFIFNIKKNDDDDDIPIAYKCSSQYKHYTEKSIPKAYIMRFRILFVAQEKALNFISFLCFLGIKCEQGTTHMCRALGQIERIYIYYSENRK